MALRDVLVELVVAVKGQKELEQVDTSIKKTTGSANRLGWSLERMALVYSGLRLIRGIKNFIESTIDGAAALRAQAATLGLTTDELQKYQYVADALHTPTRQVAFAFRFFNRAVGEAALGTKHANKVFSDLGMKIKDSNGKIRPTADLLFEFSDKLKKVPDQATRTALAMSTLGRGGAELLPLLQIGGDALRDMFQDVDDLGGGFNAVFVKQAAEARVHLVRLRFAIRGMGVAITQALLPGMEKWADRLAKIAKTLAIVGQKTWAFKTALILLTPVLLGLIGKLITLTRTGGLAFAWVKSNLAPILVITAALTALYYVFDDLWTFAHGGDSVFGELLDDTGAGNALKVFKQLQELVGQIQTAIKPFTDLIASIGPDLVKAFTDAAPALIKWSAWFVNEFIGHMDYAITAFLAGLEALKHPLDAAAGNDPVIDSMNAALQVRLKMYQKINDEIIKINTTPAIPFTAQDYNAAYGYGGGTAAPGTRRAGQLAPGYQESTNSSGVVTVSPINIHVEVKGGPSNGDTANAVTKAVTGAGKSAATTIRDAHAAVNRGGMASQVGSQ
jgi:hypothetical protein